MITFTCQHLPHHSTFRIWAEIQHVTLDSADEWGRDDESIWESKNEGFMLSSYDKWTLNVNENEI